MEENMRARIEINPDILCGKPVIAGTRIPVYLILNLLASGYDFRRIIEAYVALGLKNSFPLLLQPAASSLRGHVIVKKRQTALSFTLLILFVVSCQAPPVPATAVPEQPTSIPTATPTATIVTVSVPSAQADEAGWVTYTSSQLHISFAHPHHWEVVAPDWKPSPGNTPVITLYPPADDPLSGNKVDMAYLGFEIADGQSLQTWSRMYDLAAHGGPLPEITVIRSQTLVQPDGSEQRVLHRAGVGESGPFQAVQLTHGRLVLSISAYTHADVMTEVLEKIATSIEFTPGAPKTLNELYGTDREWPSLEEVLEQNRRDAISAPFCDIVCRDAEASKHITPVPPPTLSPEFLEQERKWREWLETATAVALSITPTATPSATPTATPIPAGREGFVFFRGRSAYQERPLFQVSYAIAQWKLEDTTLEHRRISGCKLWLTAGGMGVRGPMVVDRVELAGHTWGTKSFPQEGIISYALDIEGNYYLFVLNFSRDSEAGVASECQAEAEAVLDTFEIVDDN